MMKNLTKVLEVLGKEINNLELEKEIMQYEIDDLKKQLKEVKDGK